MAIQPVSPHGHDSDGNPVEGKDPLAQGKTLYPRDDTKADSNFHESPEAKEQTALEDQAAAASNSDGSAPRDDTPGVTPDEKGTLPADAKVANDVGSDKGNTSPSNKPATPNAEPAETAPAKVSPIDAEKQAQATDPNAPKTETAKGAK